RAQTEIERAIMALDPGGATEVHTVEASRQLQAYPFTAAYWVASTIGAVALVLTLSGVYAVLAYLVEQRRKELGIRAALGAARSTIVRLVLGRGARLALWGVLAGIVVAAVLIKILASQFFFKPFDVAAYAGGAALVYVACLAAAFVPSHRASRVDPLDVLRAE